MLDPWIIEEIRRREQDQRREEQERRSRVEIQIETPSIRPELGREDGGNKPSDRGVTIVDYAI
jgi:hypothetical protein